MNTSVKQLAVSPRGRRVLEAFTRMMAKDGVALDGDNRIALRRLLDDYWANPGATQQDINSALDEKPPRTIVVGVDQTDCSVSVHVPEEIGDVRVVFLEVDDPDYPGYDARGLPHPERESEMLELDPTYKTFKERF